MKKLLASLTLVLLISGLYFTSIGWALNAQNESFLPKVEEIKRKHHFNNLLKIKQKDELEKYLDKLNEKEFLLTIAEAAEELNKRGAYTEMELFTKYVDIKLLDKLKEKDYLSIIENPSYSDAFKTFMIDTYCYSKTKFNQKSSEAFNQALKNLIKNKNNDTGLRFYALSSIDDFNQNDIETLIGIMNTEQEKGYLKAAALKALKKASEKEAYSQAKKIIKNYQLHSIEEVDIAMITLIGISDNTIKLSNDVDTRVEDIENIIKSANNQEIIRGAVFALGDSRSEKSVKTVINNRQKIKDEGLISYYLDRNYLTVEKMLDKDETITIALTCINIAPFKNFIPKLEKIANEHSNEDVQKQAKSLIEKINENSLEHNIKWD